MEFRLKGCGNLRGFLRPPLWYKIALKTYGHVSELSPWKAQVFRFHQMTAAIKSYLRALTMWSHASPSFPSLAQSRYNLRILSWPVRKPCRLTWCALSATRHNVKSRVYPPTRRDLQRNRNRCSKQFWSSFLLFPRWCQGLLRGS